MAKKKKAERSKRIPQRTCIACRQSAGKRNLIRLVRTQSGIEIDQTGKKAGRGAYLCNRVSCWQTALNENRIGSGLKTTMSDIDRQKISEFIDTLTMEDHV